MASEERCSGETYDRTLGFFSCSYGAKYHEVDPRRPEEGEQWWCGIHAPSKVAERQARLAAKENAKRQQEQSRRAAVDEIARRLSEKTGARVEAHKRIYGSGFDYVIVKPMEFLEGDEL